MRWYVGVAMLVVLGGCDADNVHYKVSNNPSGTGGSQGGTVIIVVHSASLASAQDDRVVHLEGTDMEGGALRVWLPAGQDIAILQREDTVEVRSPLLASRPVVLPGAGVEVVPEGPVSLLLHVPDSSLLDRALRGPGSLRVHADEPLLTLEHDGGTLRFETVHPTEPQPCLPAAPGSAVLVQAVCNRYLMRVDRAR